MSDDKKQKGNWRFILVRAVLGSVISVATFSIYPLDRHQAKNPVINRVKNLNWGWTSLAQTQVLTTNTETASR